MLKYDRIAGLGLLKHSLRLGSVVALPSGALVSMAALFVVGDNDAGTLIALTASVTAFISPIQDHPRRVLYLSGYSWHAALVSSIQFGGVVVGLLLIRSVDDAWAPFGGLAFANVVSTLAGLWSSMFAAAERRLFLSVIFVDRGTWFPVHG